MPIIKSAIKRVKTSETRRRRNLIVRNHWKKTVKDFKVLAAEGKKKEAAKMFPLVQKALDVAAKKNIIRKQAAARKKSRLSKLIA